jgi:hypothetical protein
MGSPDQLPSRKSDDVAPDQRRLHGPALGSYYFSVGNRQLTTPVPDSYHFPSQFCATAN